MDREETKVAVLAIILEDVSCATQVNEILHDYNDSPMKLFIKTFNYRETQ